MNRIALILFCWGLSLPQVFGSEGCDIFVKEHPREMRELFQRLDLERREFSDLAQFVKQRKWIEACQTLLLHYRQKFYDLQRQPSVSSRKRDVHADQILRDQFTLQGITATQPRTSEGKLDWHDQGPKNDPEWAWMLNRHQYFADLLSAWVSTGNADYAVTFDRYIRDWITSNSQPFFSTDSGPWRVMEVGRRLSDTWAPAFYGFQQAGEFSDTARLLMLLSVAQQADFCMKHHTNRGNHLNAEMVGLASAAVYWPEFKNSKKWLDHAVKKMHREFFARIYPDGVQQELSNHYQIVVARHADAMTHLLTLANHPARVEFQSFADQLWETIARVTKPDGNGPLNNDADLENNRHWLAQAARARGISQWKEYQNSSIFLKWAGQIIMRGRRGLNADWLFFDAGPLGIAHQHYDKLHISLFTAGRDVLVDAGRFTYRSGWWRRYFAGPQSHNVVLIDRCFPKERRLNRKPANVIYRSMPEADFALAQTQFKNRSWLSWDRPVHKRAVLYVRNSYWLVVDEIVTFQKHTLNVPWHFHPDCVVRENNLALDEEMSSVRLQPAGNLLWKFKMLYGHKTPFIQGWWSPFYNRKQPAPTAVYTVSIHKPTAFAWLIAKNGEEIKIENSTFANGVFTIRLLKENNHLHTIFINMRTAECKILNQGHPFLSL
ncbi:MAG: alginate lyase family protein [Verrucomicrobiota bacterium]